MKINEVIEEGFWADVAKGAGFKHTAAALRQPEENAWEQAVELEKLFKNGQGYQQYLSKYPKGYYADTAQKNLGNIQRSAAAKQPPQSTGTAQTAADKAKEQEIINQYTAGLKNIPAATGTQPTAPASVNYDIPPTKRGYQSPRAVQAQPTVATAPQATAPVGIPARAKMATAKATAAAGPKLGKKGEPLDLNDPKFAKLRAQLAAKGALPSESKIMNKENIMNEAFVTNKNTDTYSGYNEWKQAVSGMSAGFVKYKRDKEDNLIARYNGKIIGTWNEFEGTGYVYNAVDTGPSPIVREDITKLINEYTVKEMAVRRLKKEKMLEDAGPFNEGKLIWRKIYGPGTNKVIGRTKFISDKNVWFVELGKGVNFEADSLSDVLEKVSDITQKNKGKVQEAHRYNDAGQREEITSAQAGHSEYLTRLYPDNENYWRQFVDEYGKIYKVPATLLKFEKREEGRTIIFECEGDEFTIEQSWRRDGSPTKPVTYLSVHSGEQGQLDDVNLGRFAIFPPKEYAQDISQEIERNYGL